MAVWYMPQVSRITPTISAFIYTAIGRYKIMIKIMIKVIIIEIS